MRLIFNGAEPISVELAEEFLARLAPYGLRRTAMFPVYGLAEASLAVSFPRARIDVSLRSRSIGARSASARVAALARRRGTAMRSS